MTDKKRTIWDLADKAQIEVSKWPAWKRRAADQALVSKLPKPTIMTYRIQIDYNDGRYSYSDVPSYIEGKSVREIPDNVKRMWDSIMDSYNELQRQLREYDEDFSD